MTHGPVTKNPLTNPLSSESWEITIRDSSRLVGLPCTVEAIEHERIRPRYDNYVGFFQTSYVSTSTQMRPD